VEFPAGLTDVIARSASASPSGHTWLASACVPPLRNRFRYFSPGWIRPSADVDRRGQSFEALDKHVWSGPDTGRTALVIIYDCPRVIPGIKIPNSLSRQRGL